MNKTDALKAATANASDSNENIGDIMLEYERAVRDAFIQVRRMKRLGFGHPWIEATYQSPNGPEFGNVLYDRINGIPCQTQFSCRIRLEVR